MAEKSGCVINGRCVDYILQEYKPFRIFVYADTESKVLRCRKKAPDDEHLTDRELKRQLRTLN